MPFLLLPHLSFLPGLLHKKNKVIWSLCTSAHIMALLHCLASLSCFMTSGGVLSCQRTLAKITISITHSGYIFERTDSSIYPRGHAASRKQRNQSMESWRDGRKTKGPSKRKEGSKVGAIKGGARKGRKGASNNWEGQWRSHLHWVSPTLNPALKRAN